MSADDATTELLTLSRRLLESIAEGDWTTYAELCDSTLSAFEPEARGQLVEGMDFHRYYFELQGSSTPRQTTITAPKVRMLGPHAAVVTYVRLDQWVDRDGTPATSVFEETRIWHRRQGRWYHVHFHRSSNR